MGERDLVRNGRSIWTWNSATSTATHVVAPTTKATPRTSTVPTPGDLADELLATARSSTRITVGTPLRIADRDAYTLMLTPRTAATTVGSIRISIDAKTGLPLQVAVFARGTSAPAFQTGFTSIDYSVPAAATFTFTPPSDAKIVTETPTVPKDLTSNPTFTRLTTAVSGGRVLSTSLVNVLITSDGRVFAGAVPVSRLQAASTAG